MPSAPATSSAHTAVPSPLVPSVAPPPPTKTAPAQPVSGTGSPSAIRTLSYATETPVKDLTPHGFADLLPPPDPHHAGHNGLHGYHGHCEPCEPGEHGEHHVPGYLEPFVTDHKGFYGSAEFLLMRPRMSDFDFVIPNGPVALATTGPIESLKYDLGTGVRGEIGYRFSGRWENAFTYTYFTGQTDDRAFFAPTGQFLFPTLTRPGLVNRALTATGNADLDYQLFDGTAGRRFVLADNFAVRTMGGFRFADLRQTLNAFYDGGPDARRSAVFSRSRFQGFGPLISGEAVLVGCWGFHFYSRASFALLTGRCDNRLIETNDNGATTYINTQYNVRKIVPVGTIAIGGGWQYRSVSIRAGYEIAHWEGVFERPRFTDDVTQGSVITRPANLSLEGLFVQFGLAY